MQVPQSRITVEQQADIENLRNLMFVRSEQAFIEGFDDTEIDCLIQYITGHCFLIYLVYHCLHCFRIDYFSMYFYCFFNYCNVFKYILDIPLCIILIK